MAKRKKNQTKKTSTSKTSSATTSTSTTTSTPTTSTSVTTTTSDSSEVKGHTLPSGSVRKSVALKPSIRSIVENLHTSKGSTLSDKLTNILQGYADQISLNEKLSSVIEALERENKKKSDDKVRLAKEKKDLTLKLSEVKKEKEGFQSANKEQEEIIKNQADLIAKENSGRFEAEAITNNILTVIEDCWLKRVVWRLFFRDAAIFLEKKYYKK